MDLGRPQGLRAVRAPAHALGRVLAVVHVLVAAGLDPTGRRIEAHPLHGDQDVPRLGLGREEGARDVVRPGEETERVAPDAELRQRLARGRGESRLFDGSQLAGLRLHQHREHCVVRRVHGEAAQPPRVDVPGVDDEAMGERPERRPSQDRQHQAALPGC